MEPPEATDLEPASFLWSTARRLHRRQVPADDVISRVVEVSTIERSADNIHSRRLPCLAENDSRFQLPAGLFPKKPSSPTIVTSVRRFAGGSGQPRPSRQ